MLQQNWPITMLPFHGHVAGTQRSAFEHKDLSDLPRCDQPSTSTGTSSGMARSPLCRHIHICIASQDLTVF
jgi:hypothetical protein